MNKKEITADAILITEPKKLVYGGEEISVNVLGIGQIMSLLKTISKSEKSIRIAIAQDVTTRKENGDHEYSYFDIATVVVEQLQKSGDLYKVISIILGIDEEKAEAGFKMASLIKIINIVIEQEEIEEIFLSVTALAEKLNKKSLP